jgi:hypothetical protein
MLHQPQPGKADSNSQFPVKGALLPSHAKSPLEVIFGRLETPILRATEKKLAFEA